MEPLLSELPWSRWTIFACTVQKPSGAMTTHDDSYADASFDLDESIGEDIDEELDTPARRIAVVDSDGEGEDEISPPRARKQSPPEPSPRSSPEEAAPTTTPGSAGTRLSAGSGLASLPPLSPRRLSPMSPGIASGSSLKPLLAPKSPLPPSPRSPFSSHKPMIYVPPSRELPFKTPAKLWEFESRWENVEAGATDAGGDDVVEEVADDGVAERHVPSSPESSSVESPKRWVDTLRTPTKAERLVHRYSSVNTINPVLQRQMELSRRRREAVTKWTPPKEKRTKAKRKPALPTFNTVKDTGVVVVEASTVPQRRTATVDVNAALPVFSAAVSRALAQCAIDADDQRRYLVSGAERNPRATVAMVEDVPALAAVQGPGTPYANVPTHKRYSWYKHYGFAGKGAKTSWGYNPKREDIGARYAAAKTQPAKCAACVTDDDER